MKNNAQNTEEIKKPIESFVEGFQNPDNLAGGIKDAHYQPIGELQETIKIAAPSISTSVKTNDVKNASQETPSGQNYRPDTNFNLGGPSTSCYVTHVEQVNPSEKSLSSLPSHGN